MKSLKRKVWSHTNRYLGLTIYTMLCILCGAFLTGYLKIFKSGQLLKALHINPNAFSIEKASKIEEETWRRVLVYETKLRENHLVNGMVVNRKIKSHKMLDECDSLLFSSIRYTALKKLGLDSEAQKAWEGIKNSILPSIMLRHPQCLKKPPSRDMILGFLMTHLYTPQGGKEIFSRFMKLIENNSGFFGWEKTHYSFLTPQIAYLSRRIARLYKIPFAKMPDIFRRGYSTNELQSIIVEQGYRAHLVSLSLWIELELFERKISSYSLERSQPWRIHQTQVQQQWQPSEWDANDVDQFKLRFISQRLIEVDKNNLFYRWLRLKSEGLLTSTMKSKMLWELNNLPQFPKGALPMNCDRKADYLWMRSSRESMISSPTCDYTYSGIDYIWMASLLLN